jgi:polyphosphate kinase 2 (PPK2 family)
MFETAELGQTVGKREYKEREALLREELLEAQFRLKASDFPVIVLLHGVDGAGKGETANLLNEWMDTRLMATRAYDYERPTTTSGLRPRPPSDLHFGGTGGTCLQQAAWGST